MIGKGIFLILTGLFKAVIADYIRQILLQNLKINTYSGFENLIGVYGYV